MVDRIEGGVWLETLSLRVVVGIGLFVDWFLYDMYIDARYACIIILFFNTSRSTSLPQGFTVQKGSSA
jgi:hypothetical protein